jgi:hypothetical protein
MWAVEGHVAIGIKVVSSSRERIQNVVILVRHLDSELLVIPRVQRPNLSTVSDFVGTWVQILRVENSPDSMSFSTLLEATHVGFIVALMLGGTAVILPKKIWIFNTIIWVSNVARTTRELVVESHVTVSDGLVTSSLIESVGNSDGNITLGGIIRSRKLDSEPTILPSTDRPFTLKSLVCQVSKVVSSEGFRIHDVAIIVGHCYSELFTVPRINSPDST